MKKNYLKLIFCCGFIGIGLFIGLFLYSLQWKCLDFVYANHPFYSVFAKDLEIEMHKRGYMAQCPNILPRTKVYFYLDYKNKPRLGAQKCSIAFISDCFVADMDVEYLRQFNALLAVNKFSNGFLASLNFRSAHFPLADSDENFCYAKYNAHKMNMPAFAQRLDEIIQGVCHEKF